MAALTQDWARAMGVPGMEAERWNRAAWLHDALKDAPPPVLARYAPQADWPLSLWHGPAAAAAAAAHGETDAGVLDAVTYHSVGHAAWDTCGRIVSLADYLEPGRSHDHALRAELRAQVPGGVDNVLREVTRRRMDRLTAAGKPIHPETLELWQSLSKGAPSS